MTHTYKPVGTSVLLELLPRNAEGDLIFLPDGKQKPGELQHFKILGIGDEVNEPKFKLEVGQVVIVGGIHPTEAIWVNTKPGIVLVDRKKVIAIREESNANN